MMPRQPLPVASIQTIQADIDPSAYVEEMVEKGDLRRSTKDILLKGWPWYMIELGGGVRTISAQMLDERSKQDLLAIPGMTRDRVYEVRRACGADDGVLSNLYPDMPRAELEKLSRGAFTEVIETRFGPDGRPVHDEPKAEAPTATPATEADPTAASQGG
jgi:hypothetical protein